MKTKVRLKNLTENQVRIAIDDFYWLAVPLNKIQDKAVQLGSDCEAITDQELRKCAEESVKEILCGCTSGLDSVVDAAAGFLCDKIREKNKT